MTTMDIGKEVAALCKQEKNQEAIDRFYSPNIESVEPVARPGMVRPKRASRPSRRRINGGSTIMRFTEARLTDPIPTATASSYFLSTMSRPNIWENA